MLKQTVRFNNIDNVLVDKDLYFNLSKTELSEQELLTDGQFTKDIKNIQGSDKMSEVYPMVQRIIALAYGVRTPEGDFYKSEIDTQRFLKSLAYNQLMEDLLFEDPENSGDSLANFVKGILPESITKLAQEQEASATPGFRPGANTERPVSQPPINLGEISNVPSSSVDEPVAQNVQEATTPAPQEVPTPEDNPIQQTSTPRTDLIGGNGS